MCGIFGFVRFDRKGVAPATLHAMRDAIRHRGPDDHGELIREHAGIGNVRLSIIDLSGGHQPVANETGTAHIVFNGEIYNYKSLRDRLPNHTFKSQCDTESILHAWEEWGLRCLPELNGMFTFCIWDQQSRRFLLARDRIGIKPLYYIHTKECFAFASEIKAFFAANLVEARPERAAVADYLVHKYQVSEGTIYAGIRRLLPGHWLQVHEEGEVTSGRYWDFERRVEETTEAAAAAQLHDLVRGAVTSQMVADVPVGCFLSGGIDSTLVLHEMARHAEAPVECFTIEYGGHSGDANESEAARASAQREGAHHTHIPCTAQDVEAWLPRMVYHLDEPIAEPLLAPSFMLSRAAAQKVKVVLTGEGADELFAGYSRYRVARQLAALQAVPCWLRAAALKVAEQLLRPQGWQARILRASLAPERFPELQTLFCPVEVARLAGTTSQPHPGTDNHPRNARQLLDAMMEYDSRHRLPEFILTRADKMTMAASLEMRPPLLDNRLIDFALALPTDYKWRPGKTKYLLRRAFESQLPAEVIHRPKLAFTAPYEGWLPRLIERYLQDSHAAQAGLLDGGELRRLLAGDRFYRGRSHDKLWSLLILEVWYRVFIDHSLKPEAP
jgi:asparagine synthase (glutamine-hydrolysing)